MIYKSAYNFLILAIVLSSTIFSQYSEEDIYLMAFGEKKKLKTPYHLFI